MFNFDTDNEKPFHTSGYAEVASDSSIGATSSESYRKRVEVDNNRQVVGRYHESSVARNLKGRALGTNFGRPVAGTKYVPVAARRQQLGGSGSSSQVQPRERFSEPQGRGFNPFA